jgi:hypothetical protein
MAYLEKLGGDGLRIDIQMWSEGKLKDLKLTEHKVRQLFVATNFTQTWHHCIIYISTLFIRYGTVTKQMFRHVNKQGYMCWLGQGLM